MTTDACLEVTTNLRDKETAENSNKGENKLLPCPFCGGKARFYVQSMDSPHYDLSFTFGIKCEECGCKLPKAYTLSLILGEKGNIVVQNDGRKEASDAWNRRIYEQN